MSEDFGHRHVPWHQRLSLRLAFVLVLTMLAFDWLKPRIFDLIISHNLTVEGDHGSGQAQITEVSRFGLTTIIGTESLGDRLMKNARRDSAGRWIPSDEQALKIFAEMKSLNASLAWATPSLEIVRASPGFPGSPGSREDSEVGRLEFFYQPVHRDGDLLGWILLQPSRGHGPIWGKMNRSEEVPIPEDLRGIFLLFDRWKTVISWLAISLVAVILASVVSRWVTRRLVLLARAAAEVGPAVSESEHFQVRGADEIAMLARALNRARERNAELVQDLKQRDETRRRWIAQVSHDLRTPLAALVACLERACSTVEGVSEQVVRNQLEEILRVASSDADRVEAIATDLLEIARLETESSLHLEPVFAGEVAHRVVDSLRPLAENRSLDLKTNIEPGLPAIQADGNRLMRALENLIQNALRYAKRQIVIEVCCERGGICVRVCDDGCGFDKAEQGRFFGRPPSSVPPDGKPSHGLGLVVVSRIVESHKGQIGAENRPEGGAAVWFVLPAGPNSWV